MNPTVHCCRKCKVIDEDMQGAFDVDVWTQTGSVTVPVVGYNTLAAGTSIISRRCMRNRHYAGAVFDLATLSSGDEFYIYVGYIDSDNWYAVHFTTDDQLTTVNIEQKANGVLVVLDSFDTSRINTQSSRRVWVMIGNLEDYLFVNVAANSAGLFELGYTLSARIATKTKLRLGYKVGLQTGSSTSSNAIWRFWAGDHKVPAKSPDPAENCMLHQCCYASNLEDLPGSVLLNSSWDLDGNATRWETAGGISANNTGGLIIDHPHNNESLLGAWRVRLGENAFGGMHNRWRLMVNVLDFNNYTAVEARKITGKTPGWQLVILLRSSGAEFDVVTHTMPTLPNDPVIGWLGAVSNSSGHLAARLALDDSTNRVDSNTTTTTNVMLQSLGFKHGVAVTDAGTSAEFKWLEAFYHADDSPADEYHADFELADTCPTISNIFEVRTDELFFV